MLLGVAMLLLLLMMIPGDDDENEMKMVNFASGRVDLPKMHEPPEMTFLYHPVEWQSRRCCNHK